MSKTKVKKEVIAKLNEKFAKAGLAVVTDYRGFSVTEITDLRKRLIGNKAEYKIAKNTLIKLALKGTNLTEMEALLEGPTAVLISYTCVCF